MKNFILKFFHKTVNFLWEFPCPVCLRDNPLPHNYNAFCRECLDAMPFFHGKRCPGCGAELDGVLEQCKQCLNMPPRPWKNAMSVMKMEGVGEKVIYALKFSGNTAIARALAELSAPLLADPDFSGVDTVVPVPLHWQRAWQRGYNQSEILAQMLAAKLNKPCKNYLKRIRPTIRQATLNRNERLKNLKNAFAVPHPENVRNRKILLVDDVLTTGSTLHACAEELLKAGADSVVIFTAARRM